MPLSNIYDAKSWFDNVTREIKDFNENDAVWNERWIIADRASELTQGLVADAVAESYMTDTTPSSSTGKYGSSGMSYAVATRTLTATMSTAFNSTDVGKWVSFREGETTYGASIQSYGSATTVVLTGINLPSANIATVDAVIVLATPPSGDTLDISGLRLLRYGTQERIKLFSTATNVVERVSDIAYQQFPTTATFNINKIVWNLTGGNIYLKKGSNLASYGTFTLRYPRIPYQITADTTMMDLLDGSMIQLSFLVGRNIIEKRMDKELTGKEEQARLIQSIYREFTGEVKLTTDAVLSKLNGLV